MVSWSKNPVEEIWTCQEVTTGQLSINFSFGAGRKINELIREDVLLQDRDYNLGHPLPRSTVTFSLVNCKSCEKVNVDLIRILHPPLICNLLFLSGGW